MIPDPLTEAAANLLAAYRRHGWTLATAESCTGGLITAVLTDVAGSSDVVDRGFVTYSNDAKAGMLGVDPAMIEAHGAVSAEVAGAMANGVLAHSTANAAISVTGIAGPGGGSAEKPVGLVFFGFGIQGQPVGTVKEVFSGDRRAIRIASVDRALALLQRLLPEEPLDTASPPSE